MSSGIKAAELMQRLAKQHDLCIIDVRQEWEFEQGHIPGAILLPLDEVSSRALEVIKDINQEVIVYCKAGVRSAVACRILEAQNFTKVTNLLDGILGWDSCA